MKIRHYLDEYWDNIADQRVNNWLLINGGLWKIAVILISYLFITCVFLPRFMRYRCAYNLHNTLLVYNTIMVLLNAYFLLFFLNSIDYGKIFLDFEYPSTNDTSNEALLLLNNLWYFMLTRYLDWADTVFFVLRKKQSQITLLHVYHHTVVPLLCWISFKHNALVPIIRLFCLLNSFIHVIMYGYYALCSFGPKVQKYLWWKKYITIIQMAQFAICGIYGVILFFNQTNYPMTWFISNVGQNPVFFYLFWDFYIKSYKKNITTKSKQ